MIDEVKIYSHALSDTQVSNSYLSTKDGLSSSSLFCPANIAVPGSTLSCSVIPSDSYDDGLSKSSAPIIVLNAPPVASGLMVSPGRVGNVRLDNENLGAYYNYYDPDAGQVESGSQIRWYMDGALQTGLNDQTVVPATTTQIGQSWYFTVTPHDSEGGIGVMQTSPTVTIRSNTAPVTGTPTLDSTNGGLAYADEDLVATAAATTDANGDPTTNIFHWTKDGVSQTNLQLPFDTEVPDIPGINGVTNDYSGYGNNGSVNGSNWVQDGVVGGALNFNGLNKVQVQDASSNLGSNGAWSEITVEFWVKSTQDINTYYFPWILLAMHNNNFSPLSYPGIFVPYGLSYNVEFSSAGGQDRVYWYVYTSNGEIGTSVTIDNAHSWHHIVCTYESSVGLMIYVDGVLCSSVYGAGNLNASTDGILRHRWYWWWSFWSIWKRHRLRRDA